MVPSYDNFNASVAGAQYAENLIVVNFFDLFWKFWFYVFS